MLQVIYHCLFSKTGKLKSVETVIKNQQCISIKFIEIYLEAYSC